MANRLGGRRRGGANKGARTRATSGVGRGTRWGANGTRGAAMGDNGQAGKLEEEKKGGGGGLFPAVRLNPTAEKMQHSLLTCMICAS